MEALRLVHILIRRNTIGFSLHPGRSNSYIWHNYSVKWWVLFLGLAISVYILAFLFGSSICEPHRHGDKTRRMHSPFQPRTWRSKTPGAVQESPEKWALATHSRFRGNHRPFWKSCFLWHLRQYGYILHQRAGIHKSWGYHSQYGIHRFVVGMFFILQYYK